MSKGVNKAILLGNLGRDPELRTTPTGRYVCTFSLATAEKYKDKNGEWKDSTEWHNVVVWDKLAEVAGQYLKKGHKAYIEGKIKTRSYEKDGSTRYITEILALSLVLLSGKDGDASMAQKNSQSNEDYSSPESHLSPDEDEVPF